MSNPIDATGKAGRRLRAALAFAAMALALMLAPSAASAAVPQEISYQAYLTDATGFPITAPSVDVTIDLYNVDTGGVALLSQSFPGLNLSATQGFINITLPTGALTGADLNDALWVEVTIDAGGGPETLAPRQKIVSAPQALNAGLIDGVGIAGLVQTTGDQSIAGTKTFTNNMILTLTNVNTSVSGETGAGWSLLATADPAANRSTAARARMLATAAEPVGGRLVQGIMGSAQSTGGAATQIDGGFFQGRVLSSSTAGAALVTGVGSEVDVEAGASGFTIGQALFGGRFSAIGTNAGVAGAAGAVGVGSGVHTGPNSGLVGIGRESLSSNAGVVGAANASDAAVLGLAATIPASGVGVYAFNPDPAGTALVADAPGGSATAIATTGNVAITGKATQSVLTPTDPGDLTTKDYVDTAVAGAGGGSSGAATFTRTLFVVPTGGAVTPDGTIEAPYGDIKDAYAQAKTMSPSFFNRVAIVLTPGQHTITSPSLTMDTVGIDLIGLGHLSATVTGTADPLIVMSAGTSGAVIQNVRLAPSDVANIAVSAQAGGRISNCNFNRQGGGGGTLLEINMPVVAGQSLSVREFEVYGDVSIPSYGAQVTMSFGLVTGSISSTSISPTATEILAIFNMSSIGGLSFLPSGGPGILLLSNTPQILAVSVNAATVLRGNSVGFTNAAGTPLAVADVASGSVLANSVGDTSGWTGTVGSAGNLGAPLHYNAYTAK